VLPCCNTPVAFSGIAQRLPFRWGGRTAALQGAFTVSADVGHAARRNVEPTIANAQAADGASKSRLPLSTKLAALRVSPTASGPVAGPSAVLHPRFAARCLESPLSYRSAIGRWR